LTTAFGRFASTKAVRTLTLKIAWLKSTFHGSFRYQLTVQLAFVHNAVNDIMAVGLKKEGEFYTLK
jgi:hypothetical protein